VNRFIITIFRVFSIFTCGLALMSTRACQETYILGAGTNLATPVASTTPDNNDDDDSVITTTPTISPSASVTPIATLNPQITATPVPNLISTPTPIPTVQSASITGIFAEVANSTINSNKNTTQLSKNSSFGNNNRNWLGEAFKDNNSSNDNSNSEATSSEESWIDSDNDGYSDELERSLNSDPEKFGDLKITPKSSYIARMKINDRDLDGLPDEQEYLLETDSGKYDTDGDSCPDSLEVISESDPNDALSNPDDQDSDCLSDNLEKQLNLDYSNPDTDNDGIEDGQEYIIGSNPNLVDSDNDGISDKIEIKSLKSDPLVKDT
jgi:hypothetical protein